MSGPGTYNDCLGVSVKSGDDPNAKDVDLDMPSCYRNLDYICDAIFPIHWCSYELLTKCLTGSFDDDRLDKDLLYSVMQGLLLDSGTCLRVVGHGDADRMQGQNWETLASYEFVVSHPLNVPGASEFILSLFSTGAFKPRSSCTDFGRRPRGPFCQDAIRFYLQDLQIHIGRRAAQPGEGIMAVSSLAAKQMPDIFAASVPSTNRRQA